jgi:hypothetical protein
MRAATRGSDTKKGSTMRRVRSFAVWLLVAAITGACAGASPGAGSQPPASSEGPGASQPPGVSQPPDATGPPASAGTGANGSIKYQITGDYTGSGELPFTAGDASYFTPGDTPAEDGGWYALFTDPGAADHRITLNTDTTYGEELFYDEDPITVSLSGGDSSLDACTFSSTKNDASGLTGSVVCTSAELFQADGEPVLNVTFRAQWDVHP